MNENDWTLVTRCIQLLFQWYVLMKGTYEGKSREKVMPVLKGEMVVCCAGVESNPCWHVGKAWWFSSSFAIVKQFLVCIDVSDNLTDFKIKPNIKKSVQKVTRIYFSTPMTLT